MAKPAFSGRQLVREALDRNPDVETKTLANQLFAKHQKVWPNPEAARMCVRVVRGAMGKASRQEATHPRQPIQIPKADESSWKVHELPPGIKKWLVINDLHVPYHSPRSLGLALEFGRSEGCDGVLINGDFLDFYQLSRFEKDPRKRDAAGEIDRGKRILDAIEKVGAKKIIYKGGNHCARLPKYLMQRCPELFEVIDIYCNMETILDLERRGIEYIPDMHPIRHRELTAVHGHEWGSGVFNPVNPARGAFLRSLDNVLVAHSHRTSDHTETTIRDVMVSCWSVGCLCELHPNYRALGNRWNHGFAVLNTGPQWSVENHRIVNERKIT